MSDTDDDRLAARAAWSDYRKEYGVSDSPYIRTREFEAFTAGWMAARGTLDLGGVQR